MVNTMIEIREIGLDAIEDFWDKHIHYLVEDQIITDEEDKAYFQGEEYRGILRSHMLRDQDPHHMVYFVEGEKEVGAAQYCTYLSEDGKCFILDFWVYPEYRGGGMGHRCFGALEAYTRQQGATYYVINSEGERRVSFWKSLGFVEKGYDEWGVALWEKRDDGKGERA